MTSLSAEQIVRAVRGQMALGDEGIGAYWCVVEEGGREALRRRIVEMQADSGIVPLVVRSRGFDDANAVLNDLLALIQASRTEFEGLRGEAGIAIVLLARDRLRVAQISSPMTLPVWFPRHGGQEVLVEIRDLLAHGRLTLADPDLRIQELGALLCLLEREMVAALERSLAKSKNLLMGAVDLTRRDPTDSPISVVEAARRHIDGVHDDAGYRPSIKTKGSLLARMLLAVSKTPPDKLPALAAAVSIALGRRDVAKPERSVFGLLGRPAEEPPPPVLFAHNLLVTAFAAYQLSTASAHADAYPGFPLGVMLQTSSNLRANLNHIVGKLAEDRFLEKAEAVNP